ncbi:MBL fold metallo-hydrolase [Rhabdobacter roseus]|uniref:Ribonuclease BN (tRNA processing enzyme) n=1 Tax=Rhabdobacter roseus TaxID=1655419 RepID=A0A840TDR5_9BACT|nr:MBL fold metallo-hydrolase [Rhabdobacter roseus]MBB5282256.1 ribonuclease BN (tRNA processing enzyme) [Rhabdobacter roseus]
MSTLQLTVVGSGDAFGSGGLLNTCFYVAAPSVRFLIDCGATTLPGLKQRGLKSEDVDVIILSHFHGDHFGGVPFLLLDAAVTKRARPLTIISPPGARPRIIRLLEVLYPGTEVLEKIQVNFLEYQPYETLTTKYLSVQAYPVVHTEAALPHGLRISVAGKVISYSGDTEWTDTLLDLARDADLFICECNFYDTQVKGHLNYLTLRQRLPELGHKKILLTHLDQEMLDQLDQLELAYAVDGQVVTV